jgi:hypothetical protein
MCHAFAELATMSVDADGRTSDEVIRMLLIKSVLISHELQ